MIIQGTPDILQGPQGLNGQFGAFAATDDTVVQLYQQILQRTPSASEIAYWSAGWGPTVEASEIKDFQDAAAPEKIAADAWRAQQAAIAAAAQQAAAAAAAQQAAAAAAAQQAAAAAQQAAIEAANRKAVADAYAAAQAAAKAAADAKSLAQKQAADALRARALTAVKALYLQVLGREGEQTGLDYFADKFGDVVDPDELQIFKDMAQPEIDARNKYLADMASKSAKDAADAKAIADNFAATAAKAVEDAKQTAGDTCPVGTAWDGETCRPTGLAPPPTTTSGGINPALILAAAAAYFFAG